MRYLSIFSGIEAATVAWEPLRWKPVGFAEVDAFPSAVLAERYPDVPNLGDVTKYKEWPIERGSIDVLVGGSPCQAFSVAGLRRGLDDPRGNLMLTYGAIADHFGPRWIVWENVPGVLSSNGGRDFGTFLGMLAELGYGFAYRVLDAQYVRVESHPRAVPQRRRRVFVVGYFGDWRRAASVLFESESLSRYTPPRREAGERVALPVTTRVDRGGEHREAHGNNLIADTSPTVTGGPPFSRTGNERVEAEDLIAFAQNSRDEVRVQGDGKIAGALSAEPGMKQQTYIAEVSHSLRGEGFDASEDGTGRGTPLVSMAINAKGGSGRINPTSETMVSHDVNPALRAKENTSNRLDSMAVAATLTARMAQNGNAGADKQVAIPHHLGVRRLTPIECERLQGFPDNWTLIPWRGKPAEQCPDGPRYKAIGNSMPVNDMSWLGQRIQKVSTNA